MNTNDQAVSTFTGALALGRPAADAARQVFQDHPSLSLADVASAIRRAGIAEKTLFVNLIVSNKPAAAATSIVDDAIYITQLLLAAKPTATPSEIAVALRDSRVYPDLTAAQMTSVLRKAFPNITGQQLEDALSVASYPPDPKAVFKLDLADQTVKAENASFRHDAGAVYNVQWGGWLLRWPGANMQMVFSLATAPATDASLTLLHCTSSRWPADGYSPVNIVVNAMTLGANFDPATAHRNTGMDTRSYVWDKFVIPKAALVSGENSITVTLQPSFQTFYWIRRIQVES